MYILFEFHREIFASFKPLALLSLIMINFVSKTRDGVEDLASRGK